MNRTGLPALLGASALLAGCARFTALPLPPRPVLAAHTAALRHDWTLPPTLGVADIARLAVLNNPDLRSARSRHGVAEAQLLQAGILPNPQASLSATPTVAGPGPTTAWNAGFTMDLRMLLLRPAAVRAAKAGRQQADAEILWQEWKLIGDARLLAVQLIEERRALRLLGAFRGLLAQRVAQTRSALRSGEETYATLSPDVAALADVDARLRDAERLWLQQRHALAALLGLRPDAALPLAARSELPPLDAGAVRDALPGLADRRPDLIALRRGYDAANERLRGAILAQFPNISFGLTGGSDNGNVRALGPQLNLELPVFDRGQGNIAIARASRRQLHDEYDARLAAVEGEVRARLDEVAQLSAQIAAARAALPAVQAAAKAADRPDTAALLDPRARLDLRGARFTRELELSALEQGRLEQEVAIETLAGIGLPRVAFGSERTR